MCCVCSSRYGRIGGSWFYPMKDEKTGDDLVSIGFIVDLDYADATAFRFDGTLQQVPHVEGYRITDDDHAGFEPLKGKVRWPDERRRVFDLGPAMRPMHEVRTGKLFRAQGCGRRSIC
jgi:hypothetical protein